MTSLKNFINTFNKYQELEYKISLYESIEAELANLKNYQQESEIAESVIETEIGKKLLNELILEIQSKIEYFEDREEEYKIIKVDLDNLMALKNNSKAYDHLFDYIKKKDGGSKIIKDYKDSQLKKQNELERKWKENQNQKETQFLGGIKEFDDLINIENLILKSILGELDEKTLIIALKSASDEIIAKVFKNIDPNKASLILKGLEALGPTKLRTVEEAQKKILSLIHKKITEKSN